MEIHINIYCFSLFMPKLPNKEFRAMIPLLREKGFYQHEEPRNICWQQYNESQIEDLTESLDFIRDAVDETEYMKTKGKRGRPLTDPKDLTKAILICELLGSTERRSQGWSKILGPYVGISAQLDDRTIGDAYNKPEVIFILNQIFREYKDSDGILAGDGTGLETSRKENYETNKKYREYMTSIVDSREIVQAFDVSGLQECKAMHKLVMQIKGIELTLDAGFVDRKLVYKIAEQGMNPYVFPKKNLKLNGSIAWKNMYLDLFLDVMSWLTHYHQRSHSESFHASFKTVFGMITKRRGFCILTQVTARIVLHNRRRLAYFNRLPKAS